MTMLAGPSARALSATDAWGRRFRLAACAVALPAVLALGGCISSSSPSPPANTTVVVPNGSTVVCSDGAPPPCR